MPWHNPDGLHQSPYWKCPYLGLDQNAGGDSVWVCPKVGAPKSIGSSSFSPPHCRGVPHFRHIQLDTSSWWSWKWNSQNEWSWGPIMDVDMDWAGNNSAVFWTILFKKSNIKHQATFPPTPATERFVDSTLHCHWCRSILAIQQYRTQTKFG